MVIEYKKQTFMLALDPACKLREIRESISEEAAGTFLAKDLASLRFEYAIRAKKYMVLPHQEPKFALSKCLTTDSGDPDGPAELTFVHDPSGEKVLVMASAGTPTDRPSSK